MTDQPSAPGTIPQSLALSEARVDSLSELMAKDPEKMTTGDRAQIVAWLRGQRKAFAEAEAQGKPARGKSKALKAPISTSSPIDVEDFL